VGTQLKELKIEAWELCKILANLLDNAITAVKQKEGEKQIRLQMEENKSDYMFRIANNGPEIPAAQQKLIFGRGYTTKKGEGHGIGLAIVSSILKEADGSIELQSNETETIFFVTLPRSVQGKISGRRQNRR